ncbi:ATP synthase F1 subunit epsilon [Velocimicrobium porci]|uniref:ATP synthase epsilon chain n=1 Tax=Velocimicrobium porci TaxID=2606634 RepID=A0A6L5Y0Z2_9FIRM|nr:ATP synthase F1 subunit epsilon [Velocimicrobium porci]MSS64785.1 ATP synthase F1 subunit epsilon [Velocimicrobium porci]
MNTFSLRIVASDKIFFDGKCQLLVIPAIDGEKAIMSHHEDSVIAVTMGEARFQTEDGTITKVLVGKGFVQMINNRAVLLVDSAERPEDIDVQRAERAKERAEEQMRQKSSIQEYYHSKASLARAMSRLKETSRHHH